MKGQDRASSRAVLETLALGLGLGILFSVAVIRCGGEDGRSAGRYQLAPAGSALYRIDTSTGQVWVRSEVHPVWTPVENVEILAEVPE